MMIARRYRRLAAIVCAALIGLILLALATPFLFRLTGQGDRISVAARTTYTSGQYLAHVQPWAVTDMPVLRAWSNISETMWINPATFPNNVRFNWAWPPFSPRNGVGVWGYHHLAYGNADGGAAEEAVQPRQVDAISSLSTRFAWTGDFRFGESTVLTEFYLRSNPQDNESKLIEIGWLLHMSKDTKRFLDEGQAYGTYTDPQGRQWRVVIFDTYLTFSAAGGDDVRAGEIDMLHALHWLRGKGKITGKEWLTGLAIGAEPIKGFGNLELQQWKVDFR